MAGAGDIYRHDYEDVAAKLVWDTGQLALPPLQQLIACEIAALEEARRAVRMCQGRLHHPKPRAEVPQKRRFFDNAETADLVLAVVHFEYCLDNVIDVTLRVDAARNCQAQQFVSRGRAEHHRADLDGSNPCMAI